MNGRKMQELQNKLGVGPELVCTEAGISMSTLYKVYNNASVRNSSRVKLQAALERLQKRLRPDESKVR
jgi:predicted transcriptional regulator